MAWQHIEFSDGRNPYICKTEDEFECMRKKYTLINIKEGFWLAKVPIDTTFIDTKWLQFADYDEDNNCIVTDFEVRTEWLEKHILNEETLEEFLDNYTSVEASMLYRVAYNERAILNERVSR